MDPALWEFIAGDIGQGAADEMRRYVPIEAKLPKLADVLADPNKCPLPDGGLDVKFAMLNMLVSRSTPETAQPVMIYIRRLPKDLLATAVKRMVDKHGMQIRDLVDKKLSEDELTVLIETLKPGRKK
jgi:hypothetical protein